VHSFSTLLRFIWRSGRRAAVFVLGVVLVGAGVVMFVTPGPGIVLVVAGLAVLATEFAWAEHLLDRAKESAAKASRSAKRLPGVSTATAAARRVVPRRWRKAATGAPAGAASTGAAPAPPGARSAGAASPDAAQPEGPVSRTT
jgi:uncharacterized protein (TIGR02611 family)